MGATVDLNLETIYFSLGEGVWLHECSCRPLEPIQSLRTDTGSIWVAQYKHAASILHLAPVVLHEIG